MLKRDSLTAQMQQLSHVLAKVKRLILEDKEAEASTVVREVFSNFFGLNNESLFNSTEADFNTAIATMKGEELNMLASFIDEFAGLQEDLGRQVFLYQLFLLLVETMERNFGFISLEHLDRKKLLEEQLSRL